MAERLVRADVVCRCPPAQQVGRITGDFRADRSPGELFGVGALRGLDHLGTLRQWKHRESIKLSTLIANLQARGVPVNQEMIHSLEDQYGLDLPLHAHYLKWLWNMLQGDFGRSFQ